MDFLPIEIQYSFQNVSLQSQSPEGEAEGEADQ